jgi:hypothetical protein
MRGGRIEGSYRKRALERLVRGRPGRVNALPPPENGPWWEKDAGGRGVVSCLMNGVPLVRFYQNLAVRVGR